MDYHYDNSPRQIQQEVFTRQLRHAVRLGKPLTIHTREAEEDTERILKAEVPKDHRVSLSEYSAKTSFDVHVRYISTAIPIPLSGLRACSSISRIFSLESQVRIKHLAPSFAIQCLCCNSQASSHTLPTSIRPPSSARWSLRPLSPPRPAHSASSSKPTPPSWSPGTSTRRYPRSRASGCRCATRLWCPGLRSSWRVWQTRPVALGMWRV